MQTMPPASAERVIVPQWAKELTFQVRRFPPAVTTYQRQIPRV